MCKDVPFYNPQTLEAASARLAQAPPLSYDAELDKSGLCIALANTGLPWLKNLLARGVFAS